MSELCEGTLVATEKSRLKTIRDKEFNGYYIHYNSFLSTDLMYVCARMAISSGLMIGISARGDRCALIFVAEADADAMRLEEDVSLRQPCDI